MKSARRSAAEVLDAGYALLRPALFRLDPERTHTLALAALGLLSRSPAALSVVRRLLTDASPDRAVAAMGLRFPNALGLAAGLDKNAVALRAWSALGFGHVEVGTVTPLAQIGNPRPRVFRLPSEQALINRMGFPNDGAARISSRLAAGGRVTGLVVGGNVGKGRDTPLDRAAEDYAEAARWLSPFVDYVAANISSPNTPGLRDLQAPAHLLEILGAVRSVADRPILVKLAPDIADGSLPELVAAAREGGAAGLVAVNTTLSRQGVAPLEAAARQAGGLSGAPLKARALAMTARLADLAAPDLIVVSVGGIESVADVRQRLAAGARLVQVYTGLIYQGPGLLSRLLRDWPG